MKKIIYILSFLASLPVVGLAQTNAVTITENFVKTETMLKANDTTTTLKAVQYYNGLGYPTVGMATTGGDGQTSYSLTTYDALNREERQYLPVATDDSIVYKKPSAIISISGSKNVYNDNTAYTYNHYDALDRVLSTELPGQAWRTADRRNRAKYAANIAEDKVWRYTATSSSTTLSAATQYYPVGSLTKETHLDADSNIVVTFKDLFGNVILQRVAGNLDTYYVYDEYGRLHFVLPPAYQNNTNNLRKYCYEYRYDIRGRVTKKFLPGAEYIQYWYDKADRVICMQDGAMRKAGKYRFMLYDEFGRMVIQGLCSNYKHSASLLASATYDNSSSSFLDTGYKIPTNLIKVLTGPELEIANYYDSHDFVSMKSIIKKKGITSGNFNGQNISLTDLRDNIDMKVSTTVSQVGQMTGNIVVATNGEQLMQVMGYDLKGNLIETKSQEIGGRVVSNTSEYTFTNKVKTSNNSIDVGYGNKMTIKETYGYNAKNDQKSTYTVSIAHGNTAVSSKTTYAYNALGQLSTVTRPFTGSATKTVTYTYDMRGWLTSITTNSFAEELFYADGPGTKLYNGNISSMRWKNGSYSSVKRGYKFTYDAANRLTDAVYGEKDNLGTNANRFTEKVLEYDKNGNIKRLERRGRMQSGSYGVVDNLTIAYNGNQLQTVKDMANKVTYAGSLDFKGAKGTAYSYTYNENGSLLTDQSRGIAFISYDLSGNPQKIYFTNGSITKYVYSATGQKLRVVHYTAKANITRTIGQHVELTAAQIQSTDSTDYLLGGSLVVRNGKIDKVLFDGGYAQATASGTTDSFAFFYQNKDHLGTVRETVTSTGAMKQRVNYYPFGGQLVDTLKAMVLNRDFQQYKYNGKEFDGTFGLNTYDYGARQHEPILARWDRIDPLCEKYYGISPYAYCANNPVNRIDPDGQEFTPDLQKYVDEYLNEIAAKKWSLMKQMQLYGNSLDLTEQYFECLMAEIELDVLAAPGQVYDVKTGHNQETDDVDYQGTTTYDIRTKSVLINLKDVPSLGNFAALAHELKHCYQFDTGNLSFRQNKSGEFIGGLLYDYGDEVEAFRRGALFGGDPQIPANYDYLKDDEHIRYHKPGTCLELRTDEQNFLRQRGEIYRLPPHPRKNTSQAYPLNNGLR
jgi:RHS repeat-associated protein